MRNYYQCKDGKWVVHTQVPDQGKWKVVCEMLEVSELAEDPRYNTQDKRLEGSEELVTIFKKAFLKRTPSPARRSTLHFLGQSQQLVIDSHKTSPLSLSCPLRWSAKYPGLYDTPFIA